jgi:hypothetical protein
MKPSITSILTDSTATLTPTSPPPTDWKTLSKITRKTKLPPILPSIIVDGETWICTQGEIMQVSGQKKAGKSNVLKFMLATALMPEVDTMQTLGIRAMYTTKDVVFVDTEQSKQKTQEFNNRVLQIAGLKDEPTNLHFYNIRAFDMKQRMDFLTEFLFQEHKDASLIIIDGITDFIDSVNNEEVSKKLIDTLLKQLGGELSIVVTIHEGKDGNGARGHIGQEIERKCVGAISVSKDRVKRLHKISCKLVRNSADFDDIIFQYDKSISDFRRLDNTELKALEAKSEETKQSEIKDLFGQIFAVNTTLDKKNVMQGILNYDTSINKSAQMDSQKKQAKRKFDKALELGIFTMNEAGICELS